MWRRWSPWCWATTSNLPPAGTRTSGALYRRHGSARRNFYTRVRVAHGLRGRGTQIQDLYLAGRKVEAAAAVPDALIDDCALVGPGGRIRDRLQRWREAGARGEVGSLLVGGASREAMRLLAEELL